jgi:hypothetical protein
MNSPTLRALGFGALLLCIAIPGHGAAGRVVPIDIVVPDPGFRSTSGGAIPTLEGFGTTSRPGEPALPVRILMVAIPEGARPVLTIGRTESRLVPGLDLAPVPVVAPEDRAEADRGSGGGRETLARGAAPRGRGRETYRRDPDVFSRDAFTPDVPVRLGRVGALRDQPFVEVIVTPILYNAARGEARVYRRIEAQVSFEDPGTVESTGPTAADPHFESAYRSAFVNSDDTRAFRRHGRGRASPDAAPPAPRSRETDAVVPRSLETSLAAASTGPRFKVMVSQRGLVRLDQGYLSAHAPALLPTDPRTWGLEVDGVEVPIAVLDAAGNSGEADGVFGAGDVLEFYGVPKTEPPTLLNYDMGALVPSVFEANDFTDTQVYWLTSGSNAGGHRRTPVVNGAPVSGFAIPADFEETATWEENNIFAPIGAADPYFSSPSLLANSAAAQRDLSLSLPGLSAAAVPVTVTARLRGGSNLVEANDHRTRVWLNSDTVNAGDFPWDDETIIENTFTVPRASVTSPVTIHAQAVTQAGISVDRQYPDWFQVKYRRSFTAAGETLVFTVPNQNARYQVSGLGAVPPRILEVGRPIAGNGEVDTIAITGATPSGAPTSIWTFEAASDAAAPANRTFAVIGPGAVRVPDGMVQAADPVLAVPGQQADEIVIGTPQTIDASPGGALDLLLVLRASQGLSSRVVMLDRIYDEFSYGRRDANAIRSFLAYAFANWRGPSGQEAPPSFVLLVGDATPDYKNTMQRADWVDQVPTPMMFQASALIGYYSSDNWLASVSGADQIPDLHLGRISTRNAVASAGVFDKIRLFETSPPSGPWRGQAVLSSGDGKDAGEVIQFKELNNALQSDYFSQAPMSATPLYFADAPWNSTDAALYKSTLISSINSGAAVLTFVGHGNFENWGLETFFTTTDALALTNGLRLPFMMNSNCLSGGFHYLLPNGSIAEGMINNPSGGAIAAFAPSGLSNPDIGDVVAQELFGSLYGPTRERVMGAATLPARAALWGQASIVDSQAYTYLGDPASRIATPAPEPPAALAAVAGNGRVDLSWVPPGTPAAAIRIYRAAVSPTAAYSLVTCGPTGPNACADTSVINATRYYYFAASVDAEGFEGANSNFNTGCNAGTDCVTARPINPNPPAAPTGLQVHDAGTGGRLDISWVANPENDLKRYTVRYGTSSGAPTASVTTGPAVTAISLFGLQDGTRYYVTVSATNTSDLEGAASTEQSEVPHIFQGIAPPRAISDLTVNVSGPDIVLSWSRPTLDIYGRPTTVTGYKVYRGTTPNFTVAGMSPIALLGNGATTTWTHPGGVGLAGNSYYIVTASDAAGLVSGAGRDLPNGVGSLDVTMPAPPLVHLSWLPVTTDVQGLPTLVDHYQIHVTSNPVTRGQLGPATLFQDNVTSTSLDINLATGTKFISVLAVDNRGNLSPF